MPKRHENGRIYIENMKHENGLFLANLSVVTVSELMSR